MPIASVSAAELRPIADNGGNPAAVLTAAQSILPHLEQGRRVDATILRGAMEAAFGASDAAGAWDWKTAYDACEAATVLFLRKFGPAIRTRAASPEQLLPLLARVAALLPTHTRRSQESQDLQQFSTPITLGLAASTAAAITSTDLVLEPSAGTGLLAVLAKLAGGTVALNELAEMRGALLEGLFPGVAVTRFDAAQIDDYLDTSVSPSVVLMNPPFSVMAHVEGRVADAAYRHIASALARLRHGGRLVAITGANFSPVDPRWQDAFARLQEHGRIVLSAAIDGAVYARHGTTIDTRLLVIDKQPAVDAGAFPASLGIAPDAETLLDWVVRHVPPRLPVTPGAVQAIASRLAISRPVRSGRSRAQPAGILAAPASVELAYDTVDWAPAEGGQLTEALYEGYTLQSIRISGAQVHPTKLVQSASMASVAPPRAVLSSAPAGERDRGWSAI